MERREGDHRGYRYLVTWRLEQQGHIVTMTATRGEEVRVLGPFTWTAPFPVEQIGEEQACRWIDQHFDEWQKPESV